MSEFILAFLWVAAFIILMLHVAGEIREAGHQIARAMYAKEPAETDYRPQTKSGLCEGCQVKSAETIRQADNARAWEALKVCCSEGHVWATPQTSAKPKYCVRCGFVPKEGEPA